MTALVFSDYTSPAVVRGLLGVAEEEIPDDIYDTMGNSFLLAVEETFEELNDSIISMFTTIKDIDAGSRTGAQQRFYDIVRLYAAYIVADDMANGSIEMFAPVKITDGKAEMDRKDPYESLRASLKASLALWKARLGTALSALDATKIITTTKPTLAVGAGIAIDPVTGV